MDLGLDKAKIEQYKAVVVKLLGEPLKMRLAVIAATVALGVGAVYMPLSDSTDQARAELDTQRARLETLKEIDALRKQAQTYRSRIGDKSDTNEWVQYLLAGSRQTQVRLRDMETKPPERVGPYKAVSLAIEMEGGFPQLKKFIEWLETSDRLLRVETVRFEKLPNALVLKAYVLGLIKTAPRSGSHKHEKPLPQAASQPRRANSHAAAHSGVVEKGSRATGPHEAENRQ